MRLIDKRFAGVAQGVGTANILGRIHSAQIRLGNLFLPVAFSVLEGQSVDLLFGLDMLKRHQACIDLSTNTLRIGSSEIHFLSEHELPESARQRATLADAPNAPAQPIAPPPPTSTPVAGPSAPTRSSHSEEAVQTVSNTVDGASLALTSV
jgi:DNA damage-inducible protein 1